MSTVRSFASMGCLLLSSMVAACADDAVPPAVPEVAVHGTCSETRDFTRTQRAGAGMADKTLALTFDDGPSEFTTELSTFLADSGVAATFFINGMHADGREEILQRTIADGHLLGNHSHDHLSMTSLSPEDMVAEVENTDQIISKLVPADRLFFRPPYGDWDDSVADTLQDSPMKKYQGPVNWDIGGELTATTAADWDCWDSANGSRTVQQCGDLYMREIHAKEHGIVLMHDGPPGGNGNKTVAMIKYLLPKLKAEGYSFIRVDQVFNPNLPPPTRPGQSSPAAPGSPVTPSQTGATGAIGGSAGATGSCK